MKSIFFATIVCMGLMGCATSIPLSAFHEVKQPDGTMRAEAVVNGKVYYAPPGYKVCTHPGACHAPEYCGFVGVDTVPVCKQ